MARLETPWYRPIQAHQPLPFSHGLQVRLIGPPGNVSTLSSRITHPIPQRLPGAHLATPNLTLASVQAHPAPSSTPARENPHTQEIFYHNFETDEQLTWGNITDRDYRRIYHADVFGAAELRANKVRPLLHFSLPLPCPLCHTLLELRANKVRLRHSLILLSLHYPIPPLLPNT